MEGLLTPDVLTEQIRSLAAFRVVEELQASAIVHAIQFREDVSTSGELEGPFFGSQPKFPIIKSESAGADINGRLVYDHFLKHLSSSGGKSREPFHEFVVFAAVQYAHVLDWAYGLRIQADEPDIPTVVFRRV